MGTQLMTNDIIVIDVDKKNIISIKPGNRISLSADERVSYP